MMLMLASLSSRMAALAAAIAVTAGTAAGCGPSSPEPAAPAAGPQSGTATPASAAPSAEPAPVTTADVPSPAPTASAVAEAPPKPGVPADSVPVPGTDPLSEAEAKELSTKCKKLSDAIVAAAKKGGAKKRPIDHVEEVLANPPKLAGVDVPRCSELLRRETVTYLARSREAEAKLSLKRIVVGLVTALEREPPVLCPSAPPVPASLDAVKERPYASTADDWNTEGWKCVRFELVGGPQVFQYELRTDAKARSYEVVARGWPVRGGPQTELYIGGKIESGAIDPSMPVMRREP